MTLAPSEEIVLSIITVVRNDPVRLAATIESLRELYGNPKFEHIVIDGSSSDLKTLSLIQRQSKHPNFSFLSEPDKGIYDAMNKGVHISRGRFLLFLNCGDRLVASSIQLATWLGALDEVRGIDLACFSCQVRHGARLTLIKPQSGNLHKMPTSHQAMVFSKAFMHSNVYDLRYRIAADFNLYMCANAGQIMIFPDRLLTDIEAVGVASENPARAYQEYLQIAYRKLRGWNRCLALARIGCKSALVIVLKVSLPRRWVHGLRRLI
jgi:putative colanic acid biosynthesis glycosyltransferase